MTDRPILFSGPMVRALLAGSKTQTRRVMAHADGAKAPNGPRFCVGDRLWVRETWNVPDAFLEPERRATGIEIMNYAATPWGKPGAWRPSIFMPRWASRLTLPVTDVRVQRLQEISADDAFAEGIRFTMEPTDAGGMRSGFGVENVAQGQSFIEGYRKLWDSLNAARGFGWEANPWVVAITFTVEQRNIDHVSSRGEPCPAS